MYFKKYIIASLFLASQFSLSAQKDTTYQTIHQETGEYQAPVIETPADRFFKTKVPARLMFKMNLAKPFFDNEIYVPALLFDIKPIEFGVEYKLSPAFSIGAYSTGTAGFYILETVLLGEPIRPDLLSASLEARWYHDMKKRIRNGRSANNFGGKYFALETILFDDSYEDKKWATQRVSLRYGLQQRFMRNGYFDISVGAGVTGSTLNIGEPMSFSLDQRVSAGLAAFLPRPKSSTSDGGLCDVLHCQDEQYKMLKINLFNTLIFQSNRYFSNFALQPQIAYEHKIGKSPFSVEAEAGASYQKLKVSVYSSANQDNRTARLNFLRWNATAEFRYFYTMRKRILNGSSGNNLSGAFLALQCRRDQFIKNAASVQNDGDNNSLRGFIVNGNYWTGNLIWGYQQRMFDRGFIQFKFGIGSTIGGDDFVYESENQSFTKAKRDNELNILSEIKVGFAF